MYKNLSEQDAIEIKDILSFNEREKYFSIHRGRSYREKRIRSKLRILNDSRFQAVWKSARKP